MNRWERRIDRILVRGTNWVGDALLTVPALASLKHNFPQAEITVLAKKWVAPVYAAHPAVDDVMFFDRDGAHQGWRGLLRLAGEIRRRHFDLAVLFQNAIQAALIVRLAGIPLRMGYNTDGRGFLLNPSVRLEPADKTVHETEYYQRMLARAGLEIVPGRPVFHLTPEVEKRAEERLRTLNPDRGFMVGLAPGAAFGTAKQWMPERFAEAADRLIAERGGLALLFGSRGEAAITAKVSEAMDNAAYDLAGQTDLTEAAALIKRCDLFITNDSGLMHVAAGVGTPLVTIFGSTNPATTAPATDRFRMVRHEVPCAPCMKPHCEKERHLCMELATVDEVVAAAKALLEQERNATDVHG